MSCDLANSFQYENTSVIYTDSLSYADPECKLLGEENYSFFDVIDSTLDEVPTRVLEHVIKSDRSPNFSTLESSQVLIPKLKREYTYVGVSDYLKFLRVLVTPGLQIELTTCGTGFTSWILYHSEASQLYIVYSNKYRFPTTYKAKEVTREYICSEIRKYKS